MRARKRDDERLLLETVGAIYDAALDPQAWVTALDRAARWIGAQRGMVGASNVRSEAATLFHSINFDPDLLRYWQTELGSLDVWAHTGPGLSVGQVTTGARLYSPESFRRLDVYHEFYLPAGVEDCVCTFLSKSEHHMAFFSLYRDRRAGLFRTEAIERVLALVPHLQRAARLHNYLGHVSRLRHATEEALDRLGLGLAFCDREGRLLWCNEIAEELLRRGDGMRQQNGLLRAVHASDDHALTAAVASAAAAPSEHSVQSGATLALRRDIGKAPLGLIVAPISERLSSFDLLAKPPVVLVLIRDPDRIRPLPDHVLATLFGLTPAEAKLAAALAQGESLSEYADRARIARETARWHSKQVLAKTGVKRQTQLVRLVLTSIARLSTEADATG
jgi:DNA-binding CsgD family transcriptional regulator